MSVYAIEMTDLYCGNANYSWVERDSVTMPELTHYGYDESTNYAQAKKVFNRELMKRAKAAMGMTGVRGVTSPCGDGLEFRPYGNERVIFITYRDDEEPN